MTIKKTALYIGNFGFPNCDAAAQRVFSNGLVLREIGYEVFYIGVDRLKDSGKSSEDCAMEYKGFVGWNLPYDAGYSSYIGFKDMYRRILRIVEKVTNRVNLVLLYGCPSLFLLQDMLMKYFRKSGAIVVTDVADWLSASGKSTLSKFANFVNIYVRTVILNAKSDGVIVASKYLHDYYKNKNKNVLILPPLTDVKSRSSFENEEYQYKRLIYAGQPFPVDGRKVGKNNKKDRLDLSIEYLFELDKNKIDFIFDIYGITKNSYLSVVKNHASLLEKLNMKVRFFGMVDHEEVLKEISRSDFMLLIRDNNRLTRAGFPTKVAESIACGTPVITTSTSDIADYIEHGRTGMLIDEASNEKGAMETIMNAILLPRKSIKEMKKNCLDSNVFDYRRYVERTSLFLKRIVSSK